MTSRDFCYWLQGYFELAAKDAAQGIGADESDMIKRHLALVFKHEIDPSMGDAAHQAALNAIHEREDATIAELKKDVEGLKKRPPQKVVHHGSSSPFGPVLRC